MTRSRSESESEMGDQLQAVDPKRERSTHGQDEANVTVRGGPNRLTLKSYRMSRG